MAVLTQIRRHKTEAGLSLRAPIAKVTVTGRAEEIAWLEAARQDIMNAGAVEEIGTRADQSGSLTVDIALT
ncbi:MAG: hypothetical protein KAX19_04785 [Candidatus Brocadiae bacterium]|nr:hypothetical protein [Candidatus Brocadiia bacterium]